MRQLTSIVAVNKDGVIGCRNSLPWRVKSDLAFFKATTTGNVVLMGRRTFDSLGRCLPRRFNVVLSHNFGLFSNTTECVLSLGISEGLLEAERAPKAFEEVFVIGGATIYDQFSDLVDRYLITLVDKDVRDGDAFFDMGIFNDPQAWEVRRVTAKAKGAEDEAAYEVFELVATDRAQRIERRREMVQSLRQRLPSTKAVRAAGTRQSAGISPTFDW